MSDRPPIRVRFRYNMENGDIEFIVDDTEPDRSEEYHDKVANVIARFLARNPQIENAGTIRYQLDHEWYELMHPVTQTPAQTDTPDILSNS